MAADRRCALTLAKVPGLCKGCLLPMVTVQMVSGLATASRAYTSQVGLRRLYTNPRRRVSLPLVRAKRLTAAADPN